MRRDSMFNIQCLMFNVQCSRFKVYGSEFGVPRLHLRFNKGKVMDAGFRLFMQYYMWW